MSLSDYSRFHLNRSTRARVYLEISDVNRLQRAITNPRDYLLIRLLFHLGCRVSEALNVKVEDIDPANNTVTIQHLKVRMRLCCPKCNARLGRSHTFCPKCGSKVDKAQTDQAERHKQRILPVDTETMTMLQKYIERGGLMVKEGKQLIFGISRHRAWQIVKECAEKANLPRMVNPETGKIHNVSPHRLRDAFSVHAMKVDDSGDGLRLLQEHLGHQSFNTTARYRKIAGEEHHQWYNRLWLNEP